ncbi:hypothetical protein B0A48_06604 [Cryoendolithus antarcticus]|uniref:Uncharacterized protein n=1 Tax=Cryoendolithus antarcticus TaxID=1507870 RepID=A0A1V8T8T6_9PEZI|nr:hypothetical protein B0A48_06604 [Cryoendolithus antarcticus]OQO23676.1 hypothetical protein B0A51_10684 [Rachicladosporium sp. CCFEE 5018]
MSTRKRKQDEELVELPEDGSDEESEEEYISEGDEDVSEVGSEEEEEEDDEVEAEAAPAPPKAKKQKTKPTEVVEEDEPAGEEDGDVEEEDLEDDEAAPDSDGGADEDAAETAKSSGPAASAKARSGNTVPKEASLEEVDDAE